MCILFYMFYKQLNNSKKAYVKNFNLKTKSNEFKKQK